MLSPNAWKRWQWPLYVLIMAIFFVLAAKMWPSSKAPFGHARDYVAGVQALQAGGDPYGVTAGAAWTGFIYPPLVLAVMAGVCRVLPHFVVWDGYVVLLVVAVFFTPWMLAELVGPSRWFGPAIAAALFVCEPQMQSQVVLQQGNISAVLYAVVLGAAVAGVRRGRWTALYVAIFCASLVKPPFLALLLLPVLAAERQTVKALATGVAVIVTYALQRLLAPHLYASFRQAVTVELIAHRDYGLGIFCFLYEHAHTRFAAMQWTGSLLAHFVVVGVMLALLWRARSVHVKPEMATLWCPALLCAAILANPRPRSYDLYVGFVLAVFVIVEYVRTAESSRDRAVAIGCVVASQVVIAVEDPDLYCAGLMLAAVLLTIARTRTNRAAGARVVLA